MPDRAGGSHPRDDGLRPGAVQDQLDLTAGDDALADQHLVEGRTNNEDVVERHQPLAGLLLARLDLGDRTRRYHQQRGDRSAEEKESDPHHIRHVSSL